MKNDSRAVPKMVVDEVLDLSRLNQFEAKPLLRASKIQATKMAVRNATWTVFKMTASVYVKLANEPFSLLLENMYDLETIQLNWTNPPKYGYNLTIINCPALKQKDRDDLKKKVKVFYAFPPPGDCTGPVVRRTCKTYQNTTNLLIDYDTGFNRPPIPVVVPEGCCLSFDNSSLKTMAVIVLPRNPVPGCHIRFENNPYLCPSREDVIGYKNIYGVNLTEKALNCSYVCNLSELLHSKKTCYILIGGLVIQGDDLIKTLDKSRLGMLYEIQEGYLDIRDTTIGLGVVKHEDEWLPRLVRIESNGREAIRIQNTTFSNWSMPLLSIHGSNKTIVFENNPRLQLTPQQKKTLTGLSEGNFYLDVKRQDYTATRTDTRMSSTATTEDFTQDVSTTSYMAEDQSAAEQTTRAEEQSDSSGTGIVVAVVIVLLLFFIISLILSIFYWARSRPFFLPPVPRLPLRNKSKLLLQLADEVLEMNPLEWRRLAHHEAVTMGSRLPAQEELRLRGQYSKFVEEAEKSQIAVSVRPPPDSSNWELFKTFKQFYEETHGDAHLILLSRHKDPSKTCPLLSTEIGRKELAYGQTEEKLVFKTKNKSTSTTITTSHGGQYEISTTLDSKQTLDDDIQLSKYRISMSHGVDETHWRANFNLKLVHFHVWNEGARDATKILRLIAYGKQRTGWKKILFGKVKRPVFMTSSSSQSYVVMMLTAVLYHVTDSTYPSMKMSEMRQLVFTLLGSCYTQPESLVFLFHTILSWAAEEKCIPADRIQAYEDFQYIVEKIAAFKAINPTTLFFEPSDLNLAEEVNQRVQNSEALKKLLESEAASTDLNLPLNSIETTVESVIQKPRRIKSVAKATLDKTMPPSTEKTVQKTMLSSSKKAKPTQLNA